MIYKEHRRGLSPSGDSPLRVALASQEHPCYGRAMSERTNRGAVFSLKYHLVWCPQYRRRVLTGRVRDRLIALLHSKAAALDVEAIEVMPDHVQLFLSCPTTLAPSQLANYLKGYTARKLRSEFVYLKKGLPWLWSRSYYIGSVGHVSEGTVQRYIANQKSKK